MPRISRASGRCSRSSISGPPIASSPGSAGTRTGRARTSGRCCSACSTTRARSTTSGVTSSFTWDKRAALAEELAPLRENALERPPVARVGRVGDDRRRRRLGPAAAGRDLALEPRQGPVVGAAAHGARRGGRLRPPPGRPVPARDDVQALAPGQAARGLPLRPARGERALPAGEHLRDRGLRWPSVSVSSAAAGSAALHLEALERLGRTKLVGVVSRTAETGDAVTSRWGGTRYDDLDTMLAKAEARVVYVAVPPYRAVAIGERLVAGRDPVPDREAARGQRCGRARPGWPRRSSGPGSSSPSATTSARSTS